MLSAVQVHTWVHSLILSVILLERYYEPHLQVGKLRLRDPRSMAEIWKAVCAVVHGLLGGVASFPGFVRLGPASSGLVSALGRVVGGLLAGKGVRAGVLVRLQGWGLPQAKAGLDLSWVAGH